MQKGFTLIELMIVLAIIMILGAIAIGPMGQQLMMGRETAVIEEIKTINAGQAQYFAQFGGYASNLATLGPPATGKMSPDAAGLIPANLAGGVKSGYFFDLSATQDGYTISAVPQKFGNSGRRTFYSDQTLVIRNNWSSERATHDSPPIQ
jgi:type IV pilus assembly protein PilA